MAEAGAALKEAMRPTLAQPGWSVSRLSRDTGIERGRIYAWWRGEARPTRASLDRVARAMGLEVSALAAAYGTPRDQIQADLAPDALAAALSDLATELRVAREEREAFAIRLGAMEAELGLLRARSADAGLPTPRAPRDSAGLGR